MQERFSVIFFFQAGYDDDSSVDFKSIMYTSVVSCFDFSFYVFCYVLFLMFTPPQTREWVL